MKSNGVLLIGVFGLMGCAVFAAVAVLLIVNANKKDDPAAPDSSADPPADPAVDAPADPPAKPPAKPPAGTTTTTTGGSGWSKAWMTHYNSYAPCCKNSPNYDPKADKSECSDYSACKYLGEFAGTGKKSFDWVKNNRIAAFFKTGENEGTWKSKWNGKDILVRNSKGTTMRVKIIDTCGDGDCRGCCTKNARKGGGTLVDLEWYTARAFWGGNPPGEASVEWKLA